MLHMVAMLAELERRLIAERARAGTKAVVLGQLLKSNPSNICNRGGMQNPNGRFNGGYTLQPAIGYSRVWGKPTVAMHHASSAWGRDCGKTRMQFDFA